MVPSFVRALLMCVVPVSIEMQAVRNIAQVDSSAAEARISSLLGTANKKGGIIDEVKQFVMKKTVVGEVFELFDNNPEEA